MNEMVVLVWNGWGLLGLLLFSLYLPFSCVVTILFGSEHSFRGLIRVIIIASLISVFVTSGAIAGLLSIPLGFFIGIILTATLGGIHGR